MGPGRPFAKTDDQVLLVLVLLLILLAALAAVVARSSRHQRLWRRVEQYFPLRGRWLRYFLVGLLGSAVVAGVVAFLGLIYNLNW